MRSELYKKVLIKPDTILRKALKHMDKASLRVLIVVDNYNKLLGIVTDGDVRRAIIRGINLQEPISSIMTMNPITISHLDEKNKALKLMKKYDIKHIPVVTRENEIVEMILWEDFLNFGKVEYPIKKNSVVIMAGGKGSRLDPFTKILPKSLIPIGEKPIIRFVMENFRKFGFNKFIISLNYKAEMIKAYFSENPTDYQIDYIHEKEYLGTAGSLSLAKSKLKSTFAVTNCDILIDTDFDNLLNYHKTNENHITVLGAIRNINIPYGVLKLQNADLLEIIEKPEYHFIVNSGVYILEPDLIDLISENKPIDMTDLLISAKNRKYKIQVYPISSSWFDVGDWEEYKKAVEHIKESNE